MAELQLAELDVVPVLATEPDADVRAAITVAELHRSFGVAVLVAVLGTPDNPAAALSAFRDGWIVIAAVSLASAAAGLILRRPRRAVRAQAAFSRSPGTSDGSARSA